MLFGHALVIFTLILWKLRCPKSTAQVLTLRYGITALAAYRNLEKTEQKASKIHLDILFLHNCKEHNVLPKFLKFKVYSKSFSRTETYREWQNTLLDRELKQQQRKLKVLQDKLTNCKVRFKSLVSFLDYLAFTTKSTELTKKIAAKIESRHEKKLDNLGIHKIRYNENCIFNLSSRRLTPRETKILMLGLDFCIPFYKKDWLKHYISVEKICNTIQDCARSNLLRNGVDYNEIISKINELGNRNFKRMQAQWRNITSRVFKREDIEVLKELGSNKDVIIVKPDKGKGVVIMNRDDYLRKMKVILNDNTKFRKVNGDLFDINVKLEDKLNRLLRPIRKDIGDENYNFIYASGSAPGIMFGQPKVHKLDNPLRPIVSSIGTAGYNLAKFLQPLVIPLTCNQYTVKNSKTFVDEITKLNLPSNYFLASYDVESLFTNVPLEETLDIILENYNSSSFFGLTKNIVKKFFKFATSESCFLFNGDLFSQVDGVSMGSSLGPLFADAFLCHNEAKWLEKCPLDCKPLLYRRYVDDTFLVFRNENENEKFFKYINNQHSNIKFTCEKEENHKLAFLDVLISKDTHKLSTGVYRKPTFTGLGLSWFSFCPEIYKLNSIKTLLERAYGICSDNFTLHEEFSKLKEYFITNNYNSNLFHKMVNKFLCKKREPQGTVMIEASKLIKYIKMPFYGKISCDFRKSLNNVLKNNFPAINFKIIFTNEFRIGSFFNHKDRMPDLMCSNIVYKFTCPSCTAGYIGCSSRSFKIRIFEHLGKSYRSGRLLNTMPFSAIRDHSHKEDHSFSVSDFEIIAKCKNSKDALLCEKLLINKYKPELNLANNT